MEDDCSQKGHLPRLERHHYQEHSVVMLNPLFHARFRELILHAAAREQIWCPVYCLMPNHFHLVWMGVRRESDQLNAMRFLRRQLCPRLRHGSYNIRLTTMSCVKKNASAAPLRAHVFTFSQILSAPICLKSLRTGRTAEQSCRAIRICIHRRRISGNCFGNCTLPNVKKNRHHLRFRHLETTCSRVCKNAVLSPAKHPNPRFYKRSYRIILSPLPSTAP